MKFSSLVRSLAIFGILLLTLSSSDAVSQTLLDPYYPRITVERPFAKQPVIAYRKYLAQGLNPEVAAERSGAGATIALPIRGGVTLLFLGSEGEGGFDGQCALIDAPSTIWSGLVAPRPTVWV